MRFRTMAVAAALMTALAAPAAGSAAGAASGASAAQSQAAPIPDRFRFTFDNGETLAPNSLVRDVTGHRHPGTVLTIDNGSLSVQKDAAGRAAVPRRLASPAGVRSSRYPTQRDSTPASVR